MSSGSTTALLDVARRRPDNELVDDLHASAALLGANQRKTLEIAAQLDERDHVGTHHDFPTPGMWLAAEIGISHSAACRWIKAGHALRQLTRIGRALETGLLSLEKTLELVRFATPEAEERLIAWARRTALSAIRKRADEETSRRLSAERDKHDLRFFSWSEWDEGSQIAFSGQMPAAQGAVVVKAIERLAGQVPEFEHEGPHPAFPELSGTLAQRRADALTWLCSRQVASDGDADRATVVVHTTLGAERNATIESGGVLHPETARRLSCDARIETALHDEDGGVVGIGRASRNVPQWLYRQLKKRDGCCTFPGCGRRHYLQAHHIEHWEHGGATDLDNLTLICFFHHKLVHEYRWRVELHHGKSRWTRPDGSPYR